MIARLTKSIKNEVNRWHALEENIILSTLSSSDEGLTLAEATSRLESYGPNVLPMKEPPSIWIVLLNQVKNPLIFILIAAAIAAVLIGEILDSMFILFVIALNSALGAYQEHNAEKSAASLQKLLRIKARVRRSNKEFEIPSEELVPGDIVLLESGDKVPADLRLLEVKNLLADESLLTGESIAVSKQTGILPEKVGLSDQVNMAFAGSAITAGRGLGIVIATGMKTEVGQIAGHVNESETTKPPLIIRMERFTRNISVLILIISLILTATLLLQGSDIVFIFFVVVALAVSAIPEGLPVALTVALSIAVSRMSKRNVIVRKLPAVESLGSCTVIASDKTGTLTVNQQTARSIVLADGQSFNITGQGYNDDGEIIHDHERDISDQAKGCIKEMAKLAMLANEASLIQENGEWVHYGDAIDVAFLAMGYKLGIDPKKLETESHKLGIIPYESERKYSAAFYSRDSMTCAAVKGAAEMVLSFCSYMMCPDGLLKLDRERIVKQAENMAAQGYRVLAIAGAQCSRFVNKDEYDEQDLPEMVFYGLVGFIDPLRPEAINSVFKCKTAGIKVIMITGDHPRTAEAIARELGIADKTQQVVTGEMLSKAGTSESQEFIKLVSSASVFARVSPLQKLEIVEALINQGEFVAVTGDGVNDAPALRRAHIGVAMGSGTDVAKEISSMIVTDDNFSSIVSGVEEGRFAYDNVRKVVYLLISTGAAEVALFAMSIFAGLPLPLIAVQLLWLNLVTNGIQDVALAFEGGEPEAMKRKARKTNEPIFNSRMISQTIVSGLTMGMIALGFWYFLIELRMMDETHARNIVLLLMVLMQNVHVFNCRSEVASAFKVPISRNYILIFGVLVAQGIHILSMHLPLMQKILRIEAISIWQWFEVLVLALPMLLVMEIYKIVNKNILNRKHV